MNSRRKFIGKIAGASALLSSTTSVKASVDLFTQPVLPSLEGRKILFTYGGWDGHEPKKFRDYLSPWLREEGAEVLLFDNLDCYADESLMKEIDLVIQIFTMSEITREQEKAC